MDAVDKLYAVGEFRAVQREATRMQSQRRMKTYAKRSFWWSWRMKQKLAVQLEKSMRQQEGEKGVRRKRSGFKAEEERLESECSGETTKH